MSDKDKTNVTRVTADTQARDEKQARIIIGVIVAVMVLFVFIVIASMNSDTDTTQTAVEPEASAEQAETSTSDLARRVEENFLAGWGVSSFSEMRNDPDVPADSNSLYVTGFEDVSSGTVRVFVQKDISKEEAADIGRDVMTMTGFEVEDLSTVVVRGTDGLDVNFFRDEIPAFR